jgi:hypothetical protein
MWPSQWHAAQAAWQAAQEHIGEVTEKVADHTEQALAMVPAAPAVQTIGRTCVMCGQMNVWDVEQAAPRAPLSDQDLDDLAGNARLAWGHGAGDYNNGVDAMLAEVKRYIGNGEA